MNPAIEKSSLAAEVITAVRGVIGKNATALHEPNFGGNEWAYLKECLDSTFVSSVGKFVDRFESELAQYTGSKFAIATANGTAALHVSLLLAGVQAGDEVIIPALTFVATANAVAYCGAIPHLADSEENTLGLDPVALRVHLDAISEKRGGKCVNKATGRIIRAMVPMHTFGHPADIEGILAVARDYNLQLIEDAAESLGSTYHGIHTGTFGVFGTLSFNGNKTITTGGGGAILTNDSDLARRAKHLTTTAKTPHRWEFIHDAVGFNYRMPNINAALGCAQLEQLPSFIRSKRELFERYRVAFGSVNLLRIFREPSGCRSNYWLQTLILDEEVSNERDVILEATNDSGIMTRPAWTLVHRLDPYKLSPSMALPVAESLSRRIINLPSSSTLGVSVDI